MNRNVKSINFKSKNRNGKRKSRRQLSFKKSTHFILRLKPHLPNLLEPRDHELRKIIWRTAIKHNIKIYRLVLNHTHLHCVLLLPNRKSYVGFVREVTSRIVQHLTSTIGICGVVFRKIFIQKPFTRAVSWGRSFQILMNYMNKNENESGIEQISRDIEVKNALFAKFGVQLTLMNFSSS